MDSECAQPNCVDDHRLIPSTRLPRRKSKARATERETENRESAALLRLGFPLGVRLGDGVHFRADAVKQRFPVRTHGVEIEMGFARQIGKVRLGA